MTTNGTVKEIVQRALERVNELLDPENAVANTPDTVLLGRCGKLDSMGFVNLVVALEEEVKSSLKLDLHLADHFGTNEEWGEGGFSVGDLMDFVGRIAAERQRIESR